MKNIKAWIISFLIIFISILLSVALFGIIIYVIWGYSSWIICITYSLSYAIFSASRYKNINTKIPIKNSEYLLIDLQCILIENNWRVKKFDSKKIELKIPVLKWFPFLTKLEIKLFDNYIELNGPKKYIDELMTLLKMLS